MIQTGIATRTKQTGKYRRSNTNQQAVAGFTLIELLIAVAILGIILAVGLPSYSAYVTETRRSDAHLALLEGVQEMERCRSTSFTYTGCDVADTASEQGYYTIDVTALSATGFTITATATGSQASDTTCATMTINDLGARTPATGCWN